MAIAKISSVVVIIIVSVNLFETSGAWPQMDYSYESHIPSGVLRPISGTVPITVRKQPPSGPESVVLRKIRHKVDKSHVRELDYSIQQDLFQDVQIPFGCNDRYGIRDGVIKHLLRGTRDVIVAVFQDVQDLVTNHIDDIPLAPNIVTGVSKFITDILCGGEDVASDFAYYFDALTVIITRILLDFIEFRGAEPLLDIPKGLLNVTELASRLATTIVQDIVGATERGVIDFGSEIESGFRELVRDVFTVASDVGGVVQGVEEGAGSVIMGVENAVDDVIGAIANDVGSVASGVENKIGEIITGVRGRVDGIVGKVGKGIGSVAGGVHKGVGSLVTGVENAVDDIIGAL